MKDVFDTKIEVELTLGEFENLIVALRYYNLNMSGSVRSNLEEKLDNIAYVTKMSISGINEGDD